VQGLDLTAQLHRLLGPLVGDLQRAALGSLKALDLSAKPLDFSHAGDGVSDHLKARVAEPLQDDLGGGFGIQNFSGEILAAKQVGQDFDWKQFPHRTASTMLAAISAIRWPSAAGEGRFSAGQRSQALMAKCISSRCA
jgi:hypothetical protein